MGKRKKVIKDSSDEEESGSESSSASSSSESSSAASSSASSSSESGSESSGSSSASSSEEEKVTKKSAKKTEVATKKKSEPVTPAKKDTKKKKTSDKKKKSDSSDDDDDDKKKKKSKKEGSEEKSSSKKKHKKKKDPNAPKRPITAFIQFSNKMRDTAKERLTSEGSEATPKDVVRKLGEMWKALSEEQKKPYNDEAKKDKDRYDAEMAKYVPPAHSESDSESSGSDDDGKRKKKKVKKDPNAPKKNKSSYIIFTEVNREKVAEELKKKMGESFTNKEVMKEMGKRWGALPEKEKEQYKILADEDKKRYETELANYKSNK